jgi:hypothetical protein
MNKRYNKHTKETKKRLLKDPEIKTAYDKELKKLMKAHADVTNKHIQDTKERA